MTSNVSVTVTILTKNEASLIERCISSVAWADEILVLDSGSTDGTRELAQAAGAKVHEQCWLGWVPQRQRAIELARNDWILVLEADEIVTAQLAQSVQEAMENNPRPEDGYSVDRRDELFGKLLPNMKRDSMRRTFVRLFNRRHSRYDPNMPVHERVLYPGKAILLPGILLHWRNVGFVEQQRKGTDYAVLEAKLLEQAGVHPGPLRIIAKPLLRFLWTYLLKGGFRAGMPGLIYALMAAQGEFLRNTVLWEKQSAPPTLHPPAELVGSGPRYNEAKRSIRMKASG